MTDAKIVERTDLYPKSYGAWAGKPQGNKPDYTRCCEQVWSRDRWSRSYQCTKKRGFGPDGAYCKQHDPAVAEARKVAADARGREKINQRRYEWHGRTFFDALLKIAEGHNDAMGLAKEVISDFQRGQR